MTDSHSEIPPTSPEEPPSWIFGQIFCLLLSQGTTAKRLVTISLSDAGQVTMGVTRHALELTKFISECNALRRLVHQEHRCHPNKKEKTIITIK